MDVIRLRRGAAQAFVALLLTLGVAGCGTAVESSPAFSPSPSEREGPAAPDLSVIACAMDDPADTGALTGAWDGSDGGVYYIRQVGDCVWWFGTEVDEIVPGTTGQAGFANVASGRMVGTRIDLEWADIPLGNILNGGGLTFVYDEANDTLTLTEQRGGWEDFGGSVLTRIDPPASPEASPSASVEP
jgi:hypothetical protein